MASVFLSVWRNHRPGNAGSVTGDEINDLDFLDVAQSDRAKAEERFVVLRFTHKNLTLIYD
jgi:hypothetical protein